jgi:hypothetical protein
MLSFTSNMKLVPNDLAFYRGLNNLDYIYPILASKLQTGLDFKFDELELATALSERVRKKLEDPKLENIVNDALDILEDNRHPNDIMDLADNLVRNTGNVIYHYLNLYKYGRNIFSLSETLWDLLSNTDSYAEPFNFSSYPYRSFYLHFDKSNIPFDQPEGEITNGRFLTGVFVTISDDNKQCYFLFCSDLTFCNKNWFADPFPSWEFLSIELDDNLSPFELITKYVDRTISEYDKLGIAQSKEDEEHIERIRKRKINFYSSSITTIINAMLYLTSESNHTENDSSLIPNSRLETFKKLKKIEKPRAGLDLDRLGLIKFNRSGYDLNNMSQKYNLTGVGKRAHWRRGFWRNQAFGPRSENQHRLKWIMPTIVGGENGDIPLGHTYDVSI